MMIKGIAITTILILTVGIIVSGLVIYQSYKTFTTSTLSEHECRVRLISWCIGCMNMGWSGGVGMSSELSECANKYWGIVHTDCDAEDDCSGFIPTWSGGSEGSGVTTTIAPTTCADAGGETCARSPSRCAGLGGTCIGQYDCPDSRPCCCDTG